MIFGKACFFCKLVQGNFFAVAGAKDIHGARKTFVKLDTRRLPDGWQLVDDLGNVPVLLQMIGQQGGEVFFETQSVVSFFFIGIQDRPDQGVECRIPGV